MVNLDHYTLEKESRMEDEFQGFGTHNLQRKAYLIHGGPVNHAGNVVFKPNKDFDLNKTIFGGVSGLMGIKRTLLKFKLSNSLYWHDDAKEEIEKEYKKIPELPRQNMDILAFMRDECDFKCEHADGSFMDHLYFVADYGHVHYNEVSPRVLFLHSIMGVGTNIFPMEASKIPKLQSLLTDFEFKHIAAFPSFIRMITHNKLLPELTKKGDQLDDLESITFYRIIDNEPMTFSAEDFWIALNYQVVHFLDFLPATNWKQEIDDPLFQQFLEMHNFLTKFDKLVAHVDKSIKSPMERDDKGKPLSLGMVLSKALPKSAKRWGSSQSIKKFSDKIGHNIGYELKFKD